MLKREGEKKQWRKVFFRKCLTWKCISKPINWFHWITYFWNGLAVPYTISIQQFLSLIEIVLFGIFVFFFHSSFCKNWRKSLLFNGWIWVRINVTSLRITYPNCHAHNFFNFFKDLSKKSSTKIGHDLRILWICFNFPHSNFEC